MNGDDDIYDSDSDLEELACSGEDIKIIYFDNVEQYLQSRKELDIIYGPNVIQYIKFKPINA